MNGKQVEIKKAEPRDGSGAGKLTGADASAWGPPQAPMGMMQGPNGQMGGPPMNMGTPMGPNMLQSYQGWGTSPQQQSYPGYGTPSGPGSYQGWGAPPAPQGPPQWGNNYGGPPQQQGYGSYGKITFSITLILLLYINIIFVCFKLGDKCLSPVTSHSSQCQEY